MAPHPSLTLTQVPDLSDADELQNHWWWRPGWRVGTRYYAWHLLLDDQPALADLAAEFQAALGGLLALDPVPRPWLHLTVQGVGHASDVGSEDLDRVVQAVAARVSAAELPPVRFDRPTVFGEGVVLVPSPTEPFTALYDAVRRGLADARGPTAVPEAEHSFVPHVTVAYASGPSDAAPVRAALEAVRPTAVTTRWAELSLIRMHRDWWRYEWTVERTVAIGGR